MRKHKNIIIEGRLSEKDFNYYCQTGAYKYQIDAIYTNGNDKDIYIEAEGIEENLLQYIDFLKSGPLKNSLITFKTEDADLKDIKGFSSYRKHQPVEQPLTERLFKRIKKIW